MDTEIKIGREKWIYEDALYAENDVVCKIDDANLDEELSSYLEAHEYRIRQLVAHHLGIRSHECEVLDRVKWMSGRFNVCIPVGVKRPGKPITAVAFRCPRQHRLKTTVDEKMRAEIGAQVWIDEHCPRINTPRLIGFGLANGLQFTHSHHRPPIQRLLHSLVRKIRQWLHLPLLSAYIRTRSRGRSNTIGPYMIAEHIMTSKFNMLSLTWSKEKHNVEKRERVFRGIARIILDLARIPQPRIGSMKFYDNGVVSLSGRYLTRPMAHFESQGSKQVIAPGTTYDCSDSFMADLVSTRLERFLSPHSRAFLERHIVKRIAMVPLLRAMAGQYLNKERRQGPFLLQLPDLHWSNIFVDANWNVTHLIDLEWINAVPSEFQTVPEELLKDLASVAVGDEQAVAFFNDAFAHFCTVLREEEASTKMNHNISIADAMDGVLDNKLLWFWYGLCSESDLDIVGAFIEPYKTVLSNSSWSLARSVVPNMEELVDRKSQEFLQYKKQLRARYGIPDDAVLSDDEDSSDDQREGSLELEE